MRSRSSSLSSPDVSSSDFSVVSPPIDPVDPLTRAMEQVDLDTSAHSTTDDDSFEIVVMPISPSSVQSEQSLFSVLSIPSSGDSHQADESESESDSDESLPYLSSEGSPGSALAHSGRSAQEEEVSLQGQSVSSHPQPPSSPQEQREVIVTSAAKLIGEPSPSQDAERQARPAGRTAAAASAPTSPNTLSDKYDVVSESDAELSEGKRQRRNEAAAKAAACRFLEGDCSAKEAREGLSEAQRMHFYCILMESLAAAEDSSSSEDDVPRIVSSTLTRQQRKNRRRAAVKAAVRAVQAGLQTPTQATADLNEAQKCRFIWSFVKPAGAVDSTARGSRTVVDFSELSKQQRRRRRRAAVTLVLTGMQRPEEATAGFSDVHKRLFFEELIETIERGRVPNASGSRGGQVPQNQPKPLKRAKRSPTVISDGASDTGSESGYSTAAATVMSADDAASAITAFFSDTESFTSLQENKLLLWQALCIEFGLVEIEDLSDLPTERKQRSSAPSPPSPTPVSSELSDSPLTSRSATPTQANPFPTSLNQAKNLLSTAHVSLREYMALRKTNARPKAGEYAYLLHPTASSLRRELADSRQFARLSEVKAEWLNPLLKDFGFQRARARRSA